MNEKEYKESFGIDVDEFTINAMVQLNRYNSK
jgi:cytidylate kinase